MSIIVWIIIGGLAGWVAGMIMKEQGSLVKNIIVGIVGALIGGFIMSFFGAEGFTGRSGEALKSSRNLTPESRLHLRLQ